MPRTVLLISCEIIFQSVAPLTKGFLVLIRHLCNVWNLHDRLSKIMRYRTLKNTVYFILSFYFTNEETEVQEMWNGMSRISLKHTGDAVGHRTSMPDPTRLLISAVLQNPSGTLDHCTSIFYISASCWSTLSQKDRRLRSASEPGWRSSPGV